MAAAQTVHQYLRSRSEPALLLSEVVAGMRPARLSESEVAAALAELAAQGEVVWRSFPVRDPHLAFDKLDFIAVVRRAASDDEARRLADQATRQAYDRWLEEWLLNHRCS